MKEDLPKEKKWKDLYLRSEKLHRSKQLGDTYPLADQRQKLNTERLNVLFICSMNQWRSPTAEKIYRKHPLVNPRSAGTSSKARRRASLVDIQWSDLVIVMEQKHKQRLIAKFPEAMSYREIHVLDIEDRYPFMDPDLIAELQPAIDLILQSCL